MLIYLLPIIGFLLIWFLAMWFLKRNRSKEILRQITLKEMKFLTLLLLIFSTVSFCEFFWYCIESFYIKDQKILIEVIKAAGESAYIQHEDSSITFITGKRGELSYSASTFYEQIFLFRLAGKNIIHYIAYLIIATLFFRCIYNISEKKSFSLVISRAFKQIAVILLCLPLFSSLFEKVILNKIVLNKTNSIFQLDIHYDHFGILPSIVLLMFVFFIEKGTELQKEQDLII